MLVVNALWSPGRGPVLWAVDSELPVKSGSQAVRAARPHPFAATAEALAGVHTGTPTTAALLLPSVRSAPLDPPELVRALGVGCRRQRSARPSPYCPDADEG